MPSIRQQEESTKKTIKYAILAICCTVLLVFLSYCYDSIQLYLKDKIYPSVLLWIWWAIAILIVMLAVLAVY
jgi:CDP-diglyceride synthetase